MNQVTIRCNKDERYRFDLFGIVPNRLNGLSIDAIRALPIRVNDRPDVLGGWFTVEDGDQSQVCLVGDLSHCDYIGGGLESGKIIVEGDAGDFLADGMLGGEIEVSGSVGRYACSGLRGGAVTISGSCGEFAAASPPGVSRGMSGGTLVVRGNCDRWLATRMRRGIVVVHGNVAAGCANRMIAGTLVLCGEVAEPLATQMMRGTILLLGSSAICRAPAGFTPPENAELSYLRLLLNEIAPLLPNRKLLDDFPKSVWRSLGDRVNQGLGEIIWGTATLPTQEKLVAHA